MKIIPVLLLLLFSAPLPKVFTENKGSLVEDRLRNEASVKFSQHSLPTTKNGWTQYKAVLRNTLISKTGSLVNQHLPLNLKETGSSKYNGFAVKNITFQTRPGTYATANLFVPEGDGKFPGVVVMMGHSPNGRFYDKYQQVGISLALNGYVALCIDPWGAGERTTVHGIFEDHGDENNLGAFLMDVGETLMGMEITDNIRAVDLLVSLPYVDANKIGATGSSGGGNQTMWLTAMDERVKAAVPVVSAGTFEAFVMGSPCICEVLPDALSFTEEAAVLSLIAPRALKTCNHYKDANAAFQPREMLRSFSAAKTIYGLLDSSQNIAYELFSLEHGYFPEDRHAMITWFNEHLKYVKDTVRDAGDRVSTIPVENLMVYPKGHRDSSVTTTANYCRKKGSELRANFLTQTSFDVEQKRKELAELLKIHNPTTIKKTNVLSPSSGWQRFSIETTDGKVIPLLLRQAEKKDASLVILSHPLGKDYIDGNLIDSLQRSGNGIAIVDLSGTGELSSPGLYSTDSSGRLRTLSKSYLLLGKRIMGEWVKELSVVHKFLRSKYPSPKFELYGNRESGLAGLFLAACEKNIWKVTLNEAPVTYLFDQRDSVEYFSTAVHVPGILNWGDISLAAALTDGNVSFLHPVSITGRSVSGDDLATFTSEFTRIRKACHLNGKASLVSSR